MHTMAEIEEILRNKYLDYYNISSTAIKFGYGKNKPIGNMSLTLNNQILCRFFYKTVNGGYANTFIFDENLFNNELNKAKIELQKVANKTVEDMLNDPINYILTQ